jgi:type VI secretion system secreted protein Hcp
MGMYMKYGEIRGDATQEGFAHWINIISFNWSNAVHRDITTETGKGRNREQAQPHVEQMTVSKEVDHASGPLYKTLCTVPKAHECKIAFVRTGPGGDDDKYLEYTLTDTMLAGVKINGSGERAHEEWTLNFTQVAIEVKQLTEANVASAPFHFKYDLATGKGG